LAARMVHLAGLAANHEEATTKVRDALRSGRGIEKFRQMIEQQGGDPRVVDDYRRLPVATKRLTVTADRAGFVTRLEAEPIGRAAMLLGAGRDRAEDSVDPGVGVLLRVSVGQRVKTGETLAELRGRDDGKLHAAAAVLKPACHIGGAAPKPTPLIVERIS
jgi:pyrimidine-nucleoside phosphorylase